MVFNVGDRVWVELLVIGTSGYMIQVQSDVDKKPYQTAVSGWAHASDLRSSAGADLKQAIREVLLSKEFLAEFAAAWVKTPIIHNSELNLVAGDYFGKSLVEVATEDYKSPEIITSTIEPITGSESEAYYLNKLKNGESK